VGAVGSGQDPVAGSRNSELSVSRQTGNLLTSRATISFSRTTLKNNPMMERIVFKLTAENDEIWLLQS
jgi:hypothetical protein